MSLLLSHGHVDAHKYPLGMVYDESNFIIERKNAEMVTEVLLMQQAISGLLAKEGRKQFTKTLKGLNVETGPIRPPEDQQT